MKTFKWTFPEMPMTDRKKNPPRNNRKSYPGLGWLITGIAFSISSLLYIETSSGFVKGIKTYFWSFGEGTILSSDLYSRSSSGGGTVNYSVVIDGFLVEANTEVFKNWSIKTEAKYDKWKSQYAQGSSATVYYNKTGETSLGRWPNSYSYQSGLQGITTFFYGLSLVYRGTKQLKANKAKQATPNGTPVV